MHFIRTASTIYAIFAVNRIIRMEMYRQPDEFAKHSVRLS